MNIPVLSIFYIILLSFESIYSSSDYSFPDDFLFGAATASYQIEGAWNESGKGENIWDIMTHEYPELISDGSNGDIACDSYHKYEEDVQALKDLGVDFYRFSISWSRIFPNGHPYNPNSEGIDYYNKLIDLLIANNITAMVTLYHWDLPQPLMLLGGFTNPHFITYFTEYARVAFDNFGDRVEYWLTFNEPYEICMMGYGNFVLAPVLNMSGIADYLCGHHLLKAHADVYHLYNNTYKSKYNGKIGITISAPWYEANTTEDEEAAERLRQFSYGIHFHPIFSSEGDYPNIVKQYVSERSAQEGYSRSRLPEFTEDEIEYIKGTSDFLGLNHYSSNYAKDSNLVTNETSYENDHQVSSYSDANWPSDIANVVKFAPWGFLKLLVWLKTEYNDPEIIITENGCADFGEKEDTRRISYIGHYLDTVLEAIYDYNVTIKAYTVWSLLDNFRWKSGYTVKHGLIHVNFTDPDLPRSFKYSAHFYKNVIGNRTVLDYEKVV